MILQMNGLWHNHLIMWLNFVLRYYLFLCNIYDVTCSCIVYVTPSVHILCLWRYHIAAGMKSRICTSVVARCLVASSLIYHMKSSKLIVNRVRHRYLHGNRKKGKRWMPKLLNQFLNLVWTIMIRLIDKVIIMWINHLMAWHHHLTLLISLDLKLPFIIDTFLSN